LFVRVIIITDDEAPIVLNLAGRSHDELDELHDEVTTTLAHQFIEAHDAVTADYHGESALTASTQGFRTHCLCGWESDPQDFRGSARLRLADHLDTVPVDSIIERVA